MRMLSTLESLSVTGTAVQDGLSKNAGNLQRAGQKRMVTGWKAFIRFAVFQGACNTLLRAYGTDTCEV